MNTYRVGNYLALLLLPACGLYALWPDKGKTGRPAARVLLTLLALSPALFLLIGAQTRSAFLALSGSLYMIWGILAQPGHKALLLPPLAGLCLLLLGPERISLSNMLADERLLIWAEAWKCFQAHPLLGTGADTFVQACAALGITHLPNNTPVLQHPHNIYLQWLIDGGIIAFAGLLVWAYGLLAWSGRRIRKALARPGPWDAAHRTYWILSLFFWGGWLAYLIEGITAHGFYRTWWVSTAFSIVGVLIGACVHAEKGDEPAKLSQ
jgi:O-antigen ligase